ncbi:MAG: hypothetical protein DA330_08130, partial [Nitrososphaera sp.]|nr:hypothetical protein [Nitrososphaera sp.]
MKDKLKETVQGILSTKWADQYDLADLIPQQYGISLILLNKKDNHRFSPTIISNLLLEQLFVKNLPAARESLEREIEAALVK